MKYWIEKTIVNGRPDRIEGERALGKALWSPQKDKRGADIYKNMRAVQAGDVIFHLVDNSKIVGVSIAESNAIETDGLQGTEWDGPAYLIPLINFTKITPEVERTWILNDENKFILNEINHGSEVFYNNKLDLRQGAYLTPCPSKLVSLINRAYHNQTNADLPYINNTDLPNIVAMEMINFAIEPLINAINNSRLTYSNTLIKRFIASLFTKPFVILTGLSGSGKTKMAQAFAQWICQDENQYRIVPVGADWTNREPLLGYPNALKPEEYVKPDSGVLDLIIRANDRPELPHFLILDEMNLSHVERYFADFLSVMESKKEIPFYSGGTVENGVPSSLRVPPNLFIIGTVNIDETTNMFSPKVLDRANTIEFRVTQDEMQSFLGNIKKIDMDALTGKGAGMAKSFLKMATNEDFVIDADINAALIRFFNELKKAGAEFGYRSATEILRLIHKLTVLDESLTKEQKIDIAIMQKLLPKLHGSRRKLCPVLERLATFCFKGEVYFLKEVIGNDNFDYNGPNVQYPLSLEKIARMYRGAIDNGFASFAEA